MPHAKLRECTKQCANKTNGWSSFLIWVATPFFSHFILCSYLVPTQIQLGSNSVMHYSYLVHIPLCMKLWCFCAVIFIKPTIKKTQIETAQNKNNPYKNLYKNSIIEALGLFNYIYSIAYKVTPHGLLTESIEKVDLFSLFSAIF